MIYRPTFWELDFTDAEFNVATYFDKDAQRDLFDRMAELQQPGVWPYIGHAERLFGLTNPGKAVGRTIYRSVA